MPGFEGYQTNPAGSDDWRSLVGGFVINFGAIELETYEWIRRLRPDGAGFGRAKKKELFKERVKIIRGLLGQHVTKALRQEGEKVWDDAEQLAKFRNVIAHGPIGIIWAGRQAEGEPDTIVVLDYKSAAGEGYKVMPYVGKEALSEKVNVAYAIVTRLHELREQLPQANRT
jgi:hypothetical protein